MDAGVSELEFSTIRNLRTTPDVSINANDDDIAHLSRSRQVSAQEKAVASSQTVAGPDGIPREVLVAPPKPASDLNLDPASEVHLQTLIKQSVENVGLQGRSWEELLAPLPTEILALIDSQVIEQLARTRKALARAQVQYDIAQAELKAQEAKSGKPVKEKKDSKRMNDESDAVENEKDKKKDSSGLLDLHETARHLLLEDITAEQNSKADAGDLEKPQAIRETHGLPKLTKFLICVSEGIGSTRKAVFEPSIFNGAPLFQHDDEEHEDPEKSVINEEIFLYIGGTIHLKAPEREWNRIEKILALLIYAACHLKLEVHLLRDSGCPRPPPLPDKPPLHKPHVNREASDATIHAPASPLIPTEPDTAMDPLSDDLAPLSPIASTSSEESKPVTKGHSKKWSRSGLVSLFFRDRSPSEPVNKLKKRLGGRLKMHRTRSVHRKSEDVVARIAQPLSPRDEPLRMPGAFTMDEWELVAPEQKIVVNMARTEEEEAGEILTAPGSPTESRSPVLPASTGALDITGLKTHVEKDADADRPNERFKRVIERMQKAVLSVSPDVHFPPPSLLQILREQEQQQNSTEATHIPGRPLLGRLHSYAGLNSPSMSPVIADGLPTSSSVPALLSSQAEEPAEQPVLATKISIDTRAGLASLMTGNNSLDGTLRHQAIACLFEKVAPDSKSPNSLCQPPAWRKLVYYDFENSKNPWTLQGIGGASTPTDIGDMSISGLCSALTQLFDTTCSANCGKTWAEHTFTMIHSNRKINITLKRSLLASTMPDSMLYWVVCSNCGKRSETVTLSDASLAVSLGKYVELLLYDAAFHPPKEEFCPHSGDSFSLVRTFLRDNTEVRIKQDNVSLYTLRMPTAVDPSAVQVPNEQVHLDKDLATNRLILAEEIRAFFASVREIRTKLSDPFFAGNGDLKSGVEELLNTLDVTELDVAEEELLQANDKCEITGINDIRYSLAQVCREHLSKIDAFVKSSPAMSSQDVPPCQVVSPAYATRDDLHVLPAGNSVILREDELSSFIAYTLSARQYQNLTLGLIDGEVTKEEAGSDTASQAATLREPPSSTTTSASSSRPTTPTDSALGRGRQDKVNQSEWALSAKVKKTVKPTGSILSLKATTPRATLQDIFSLSDGSRNSRQPSPTPGAPPEVKAQEDDKVLEALLSATKANVSKPSPLGPSRSPALPSLISALTNRRHVSEATATSATSDVVAAPTLADALADLDISVQHGRAASVRSVSTTDSEISDASRLSDSSVQTVRGESLAPDDRPAPSLQPSRDTKGSTFSTISGFLHRGLRINNLEPSESIGNATTRTAGPHIKLTFRHGHKKMSCIVYYAHEFAALRRACGLPEALYTKSLERSHALQFSGGKTNAGFWLTEDQRLVLKEMRTTWNVSEVDAMLTFAPSYLNYLMTSTRPSLLTKIFGMYTCKIKNLKTGERQKVDYVVMEHLFFDQQITTKFDLKGISTRVARAKGEGQTLWDADWVENFQTRLLVRAHHKNILREAIAADTEFLQQNNVMDYSALVGVDDKNHTLTIGLIDTLGIFNLAKAIESNSKRVLQAERTIIPPDEYAARFQKALNDYIIASPEKFSKSPGDEGIPALHCPL